MDNRRRMLLSGGLSADPVLENNDWETISKVARAGKAAQFWNVGDKKNITINGVTHVVQIIGFDHDDVTDSAAYGRAKAGITFQYADCWFYNSIYTKVMNTGRTNIGGWDPTYMKGTVLPDIYNQFGTYEPELKNAIACVKKPYCPTYNASDISSSDDYLFLLSENELFGKKTYAPALEGTQYEYYAAGNSKVKKFNNTAVTHWLRSVSYAGNTVFCHCAVSGAISQYTYADSAIPFSPAFCV